MQFYASKFLIVSLWLCYQGFVFADEELIHVYQERAEVLSKDDDYVNIFKMEVQRIDENTAGLSTIMDLKQDFVDVMVKAEVYAWEDGDYKFSGISYSIPFCDIIGDQDINILRTMSTDGVHGNLPTECNSNNVFPKGNYFVKNAVVNENIKAHPLMVGKWKNDVKFMDGDKTLIEFNYYIRVEPNKS